MPLPRDRVEEPLPPSPPPHKKTLFWFFLTSCCFTGDLRGGRHVARHVAVRGESACARRGRRPRPFRGSPRPRRAPRGGGWEGPGAPAWGREGPGGAGPGPEGAPRAGRGGVCGPLLGGPRRGVRSPRDPEGRGREAVLAPRPRLGRVCGPGRLRLGRGGRRLPRVVGGSARRPPPPTPSSGSRSSGGSAWARLVAPTASPPRVPRPGRARGVLGGRRPVPREPQPGPRVRTKPGGPRMALAGFCSVAARCPATKCSRRGEKKEGKRPCPASGGRKPPFACANLRAGGVPAARRVPAAGLVREPPQLQRTGRPGCHQLLVCVSCQPLRTRAIDRVDRAAYHPHGPVRATPRRWLAIVPACLTANWLPAHPRNAVEMELH